MSSADEEVFTAQPEVNVGNKTYVKTTKDVVNHPPYFDMVEEAVTKLAGRNGVSKAKITDYINEMYKMEANNMFVKKALKKGLENNCFENKTGTGASGSFKLTKEFKDKLIAKEKAKAKKEKQTLKEKESNQEEGETKAKKKTSAKAKGKSKDDMELESIKEKASKKPPTGAQDKENKSTKSKPPTKGAQKTLKEKVKTLKISNSTGSMKKKIANSLPPDENEASNQPEPSTSKKRGAPKKTAAK